MATEEGLASLNQELDKALDPKRDAYLFKVALYYYAAFMASILSFKDLYVDLKKYMDNPIERYA